MDTYLDEEENNVDVVEQPPNTDTTEAASSGLQQIENDDTDGLPLPMGMAETISYASEPPKQKQTRGGVEYINGETDLPRPPSDFDDSIEKKKAKYASSSRGGIEMVSEEDGLPQLPGTYEETEEKVKNKKKVGGLEVVNDNDEGPTPPNAFDDSMGKRDMKSTVLPQSAPQQSTTSTLSHPSQYQGSSSMPLSDKIRRNIQANRPDDEASISGYTQAQMQTSAHSLEDDNNTNESNEAPDNDSNQEEDDEIELDEPEVKSFLTRRRIIIAFMINIVILVSICLGIVFGTHKSADGPTNLIIDDSINRDTESFGKDLQARAGPTWAPSPAIYPTMYTETTIYPTIYTETIADGLLLSFTMVCFPGEKPPQEDINAVERAVIQSSIYCSQSSGVTNVNATVVGTSCSAASRHLSPMSSNNIWEQAFGIHRKLPTGSSSIDFSVVITGEYMPPLRPDGAPEPERPDLGVLFEDCLNRDPESFVKEIQARAGLLSEFSTKLDDLAVETYEVPDDIDLDDLADIEVLFTRSPTRQPTPQPTADSDSNSNILVICMVITAGITVLLAVFICYWRGAFTVAGHKDTCYYSAVVLSVLFLDASIILLVVFLTS